MTKRIGVGVILALSSVALSAVSKDKVDTMPSAQELVNLYKKAVTCWDKSVAMRVELVHLYEGRSTDETDIRSWTYDITHRRDGDRCEWFGRQQFKGESDGDEYSYDTQFKRIVGDEFFLYYTDYTKQLNVKEEQDALMGSDVQEKLFMLQAQAQKGGFLEGRMGGIGLAPKIVDVMLACNSLRILGQEMISNSSCYIVEAKTKYGTFTVWIAPEKGYNALKYRERKRGPDILRDDIRIADHGITEWVKVIDSIDIRKIEGVFVPISGKLARKAKAAKEWESTTHIEVKRSEIVLNPDFKALGAFKISFPEGTEVTHKDIPGRQFRWTKGKFVPEMSDYLVKNLTGMPLPSFDGIHFDVPPQINGKVLLMCFFDIQQRPSRHVISRLAKQAALLRQDNVTVIAVQGAKTDESKLQEWIKENDISFPVGMISHDTQKTCNAWGVRSLPWLILTDRDHVVIDEGSSLTDLENQLKRLGDTP